MKFTRVVYGIAAVYGVIVLVPLYFLIDRIGHDVPPPVSHPEFYYGFVGVALLWQLVFLMIAIDPRRYRPIIPLTILEKVVYTLPVVILYSRGQVSRSVLGPSLVDPVFGILFLAVYVRTRTFSRTN